MTDHDALAALLHKHHIGCLEPVDGKSADPGDDAATHANDAAIIIAAGVRVTGDAGLRDRLLMAVGPVIGDHIGGDYPEVPMTVLYRFQSALVDAVLAALTGDTPEAQP